MVTCKKCEEEEAIRVEGEAYCLEHAKEVRNKLGHKEEYLKALNKRKQELEQSIQKLQEEYEITLDKNHSDEIEKMIVELEEAKEDEKHVEKLKNVKKSFEELEKIELELEKIESRGNN